MALDPRDPDTCFVTPLEPKEYAFRATPGWLRVYALNRSGRGWHRRDSGLPQRGAYASILREGMANDTLSPCGVYFGTGGGQLFASRSAGTRWRMIAPFLPPILSVSAAVL